MVEEIQDIIDENYKNLIIQVTKEGINKFIIHIEIPELKLEKNIQFLYDFDFTLAVNLQEIGEIIDKNILMFFKENKYEI